MSCSTWITAYTNDTINGHLSAIEDQTQLEPCLVPHWPGNCDATDNRKRQELKGLSRDFEVLLHEERIPGESTLP